MPEVDRVIGNAEKLKPASLAALAGGGQRVAVADIMAVRETAGHLIAGFDGRTRAFVQVQQGCDHRCTFCIIPFGRGPAAACRSARWSAQVRALVESGYQEVVLTGVDITSLRRATCRAQPSLGQLVPAAARRWCRSCRGCACPRSTRSRSTRRSGG